MPWDSTLPAFSAGQKPPAADLTILVNVLAALTAAWSSWPSVPALTSTGTQPTLGTGSTQEGDYIQVGKLVIARFDISFGTSGAAAGTGTYFISLPVTSAETTAVAVSGHAMLLDNSTGTMNIALLTAQTSTTVGIRAHGLTSNGSVAATTPWTWAASDSLRGQLIYQAA